MSEAETSKKTYQPSIEVDGDIIRVTHPEGTGGKTEPRLFATKLADVCDRHNIHRVLLDERNLRYSVDSIFDLINLGDDLLEDMIVFRFHRLACVAAMDQIRVAKEFESVARNRGMNYKAFDSLEEAERWLREEG